MGDLAFTRQEKALEVIEGYLNSDERLPEINVGASGTLQARYALDVLAEVIPDFPVEKKSPGRYSDEQIQEARVWMQSQ